MGSIKTQNVSLEKLKDGIVLYTGQSYKIDVKSNKQILKINLEIDPNDSSSYDDKYTLFSTDKNDSYKQTLTVKDDKVPGDDKITLEYTDLIDDLNYTLEIDPGIDGETYNVFCNITIKEYLR